MRGEQCARLDGLCDIDELEILVDGKQYLSFFVI